MPNRARSRGWVVGQQADVIVRVGQNALQWQTLDGQPWSVLDAVRTASAADMLELYRFRRQMECACNVCSTSAPSIAT